MLPNGTSASSLKYTSYEYSAKTAANTPPSITRTPNTAMIAAGRKLSHEAYTSHAFCVNELSPSILKVDVDGYQAGNSAADDGQNPHPGVYKTASKVGKDDEENCRQAQEFQNHSLEPLAFWYRYSATPWHALVMA
mmetsp:Transcript_24027/g.44904  ORF Transcript_24027/g.44904 Transcript_24027/m.44904 type:complete len:136 (-) Transcript_24027:174-581(-)